MVWVPSFKIYDTDGITLEYTFDAVTYTNAPRTVEEVIPVTNVRSKGSLFVEGGETAWELDMNFILLADDYEAVVVKMDALETAIPFNTAFLLRFDKTVSTFYEYKIKRLAPFVYNESLRNKIQKASVTFTVNSW